MAYIRNDDVDFLKEIEQYLFNVNAEGMMTTDDTFVLKTSDIKDKKALQLYFGLYGLIEKISQRRQKMNDCSNTYNKRNREYHRITNNICSARRAKDQQRLAYWENELKKLKERR